MTLETFYFIAQIIAAVAIVGSLLFVGMQIRAGIREQRLTRANENADNYSRFQVLLIENPEFRDVWNKGADDLSSLNRNELLGFGAYMALWVDSLMRIDAQIKGGYGDITSWEQANARYKPVTRRKGAFQWWLRARSGYAGNIAAIGDEIFREAGHKFPEDPA